MVDLRRNSQRCFLFVLVDVRMVVLFAVPLHIYRCASIWFDFCFCNNTYVKWKI